MGHRDEGCGAKAGLNWARRAARPVAETTHGKQIHLWRFDGESGLAHDGRAGRTSSELTEHLQCPASSNHSEGISFTMAAKAVRGITRGFKTPSPSEHHEPQQASDAIALVVLALVIANIVLLMVVTS
jgi:hypothetical protein